MRAPLPSIDVREPLRSAWDRFVRAADALQAYDAEFGDPRPLSLALDAARAELSSHGEPAVAPLVLVLADERLAGAAADALATLGTSAIGAYPALSGLARSARAGATEAAAACASIDVARALAEGLHLHPRAAPGVLTVLARRPDPAALGETLRAIDPGVRRVAAEHARRSPRAFPLEAILEAVGDGDEAVRGGAMDAAASLDDPRVVPCLVAAQEHALGTPRAIAKIAGDPRALAVVEAVAARALRDPHGLDYAIEACAFLLEAGAAAAGARPSQEVRDRLRAVIVEVLEAEPRETLFVSRSRTAVRAATLAAALGERALVPVLERVGDRWGASPDFDAARDEALGRMTSRARRPLRFTWWPCARSS